MYSTVKFLGEGFTFSEDIKEYMAVSSVAENIHNALKNSFMNKLNRKDATFIDTKSMLSDIRTQTEKFIKRLCDNGIYSETVDSYLASNAGYEAIDSVNRAASEAFCSFLAEEISAFKSGMEAAELDAMSQITGSGVTVYSSSMLTLAVTSAMECAIVKDQINKADAQYKRNIQNISDSGERARIAKETQYVKSTYIPQMDKAIWLFAYTLMDKYLNDMISAGKFDAAALDNVDYKKAKGILDNLKHIKDKAARISCIKQAFVACPYNIDVYLYAATTERFDSDTYKTAQYFSIVGELVAKLKEKIGIAYPIRLTEVITKNSERISAYAICIGVDKITALKKLTEPIYSEVIKQYRKINNMSANYEAINQEIASINKNRLMNMNETTIKDYVINFVKPIISADDFDLLIRECGYNDLLKYICPKDNDTVFADKSDLDDYYINSIFDKMKIAIMQKQANIAQKEQEEKRVAEIEHIHTQKKNSKVRVFNLISSIILIIVPIIISSILIVGFYIDMDKYTNQIISDTFSSTNWNYTINSIEYHSNNRGTLYLDVDITIYDITTSEFYKKRYEDLSLSIDDYYDLVFERRLFFDRFTLAICDFKIKIIDKDGEISHVENINNNEDIYIPIESCWWLYLIYFTIIIANYFRIRKKYILDIDQQYQ